MKHKWKEMQFTNHGGTAWVRLDEAEKALKEQGDKAYEMWYTTVQERAEKAEEGYNRVVCENQRLIQDWRQAESEVTTLKAELSDTDKLLVLARAEITRREGGYELAEGLSKKLNVTESELRKLKLTLMAVGQHCNNCTLFDNHECDWRPNIVDHNIGWDTLKGFYCSEWKGRK